MVRGDYGGGGGREAEGRREDRPEGHRGRKAVAFESIDEEGEDEEDRRRLNVRLSLKLLLFHRPQLLMLLFLRSLLVLSSKCCSSSGNPDLFQLSTGILGCHLVI